MTRWLAGMSILAFLSILSGVPAQETIGPIVRQIEIKFDGPETVSRAIIMANIQTAVGKPRSRDTVEKDVRSLIATGFFLDVRILEEPVADGVKIIIQLRGKATLKDIIYAGNKVIKTDRLKRECSQKVGDILDERKAHADALKMFDLYQKLGYPDAKVEPVVTVDRDTGKAILKFQIYEGPRVFIKQVAYGGLKAFKPAQLNKLIKTRRRWWGSWVSGTGVLKDEPFQEDLDKIREFYRDHGYIDMEVTTNYVQRVAPQWMVIHIDIFEGHQYKVGTVKIEGNKLFPTSALLKRLKMTTGQVFTPDGLTKDTKSLQDYYGARGYLDTVVRSERVPNVESGQLDLTYTIREGELTYIELIEIRGNTKTKDKVIRRELAVAPGDIYNTVRVEASKERLKNLGYFSKIEMTPEPTPVPNRRDLAVQVEEQRTGNVTFGAGFSSIDSLLGFVELTQGNFDLFNWPNFTGGGQKLRIRAQVGFQRQDYIISFTEPWFLDRRLLLGVELFNHQSSYQSSEYSENRTGGSVKLEKALNQFMRVSVQYSLQSIDVSVDNSASEELQSQRGTTLRSAVETAWTFDSRNSVFLTTRGNQTTFSTTLVGGPLGGGESVYKLDAKTTFFFPLFFEKHVLEILAAGGVVQAYGQTWGSGGYVDEDPSPFLDLVKVDDVPLFDRYFLGGANTLRGFGYQKVGPKDTKGDPIGGNTSINGTAEYSFPIIEKVRGAFFIDAGEVEFNSYELRAADVCVDVGGGVRLNLPVGPIRLDYGYPIISTPDSGTSGKFQFSVGYQF
jgi:outer membrane protein insertion porin family